MDSMMRERLARLVRRRLGLRRLRSLRREFRLARLALGGRMYAAGIDDGELGARVRALDGQIARAEAAGIPTQALRAGRRRLLVRLADAALAEDGPLPGADAEYQRAREAQRALEQFAG
jgi:hypothetical protein